uniref:Zinc finger protein hangover-like n=1 Tax=Diabrotica virgifera virgifera TaxID=50390 RepID=A0A6P7GXV5_DIAVI
MEESEKTEESCRLCDETAEKMLSIFDKNEEGIEILQVIKDCLPIVIYRTDPLSKQICESCSETLNSLSSFKKNCEEISQKQKEKLKEDPDNKYEEFLTCGEEKVKVSAPLFVIHILNRCSLDKFYNLWVILTITKNLINHSCSFV